MCEMGFCDQDSCYLRDMNINECVLLHTVITVTGKMFFVFFKKTLKKSVALKLKKKIFNTPGC